MDNKKQKTKIQTGIKALWRHMRPFKRQLIILSFLGLISAAANGFVPYITGRFFDTLINVSQGDSGVSEIQPWIFFLGLWAIIQFIANNIDWVIDRIRRSVDTRLHLSVQTSGFIHLLHLPLSFHKNTKINETIERFHKAGWRSSAILQTAISIAPQFLSILIGIVLAATINITLAGILTAGVVLYIVLLVRILRPVAAIDEVAHRTWNESWGDAAEAVHQIETVKQAVAEAYEIKKTQTNLLEKTYTLWYRLERIWSNVNFFQRIIVFFTQLAVFIVSVYFIKNGIITVGELVALNGYALMFFGPFVSLGHSWQTIQNGLTSAVLAEEIYSKPEEEYAPKNARNLSAMSGAVEFNSVTFRYGKGESDVLQNMNLKVKEGEVVAFVGESGVGKSTAIALISGYYFPTKGSVLIDGIDTRAINLIDLRKNIGVVPQEVALFNNTIKENIKYGVFNATDAAVERVAKEAHIDAFIKKLPLGYETIVGERGIKLSVGQKQRIAIARAMLRDPKILILDEPTSALDAKIEHTISESLQKLMKGRTTFIIAHRLSTTRRADRIFVFEKGGIVEEGTHDELIAIKNGTYRHLYEYQIGGLHQS
ncbi:MAG: ABC transporter ATP-binding protein [Parcubacteria group bacterium]|nr:ABC transporter ATP-binding protein [Parcubacteria group bacterium]